MVKTLRIVGIKGNFLHLVEVSIRNLKLISYFLVQVGKLLLKLGIGREACSHHFCLTLYVTHMAKTARKTICKDLKGRESSFFTCRWHICLFTKSIESKNQQIE